MRSVEVDKMDPATRGHIEEHPVWLSAGEVTLAGNLAIPEDARGVVLFAHGSGSSRHSRSGAIVE